MRVFIFQYNAEPEMGGPCYVIANYAGDTHYILQGGFVTERDAEAYATEQGWEIVK